MASVEKRLERLEHHINSRVSWGKGGATTFETKDGEAVEIGKAEVMEVYKAASQKAWEGEGLDPENELIGKVLNAREGNNIGHYLKTLIEGEKDGD